MSNDKSNSPSAKAENPIAALVRVRPRYCVHPGLLGLISIALLLTYGDMPHSYYAVLRIALLVFGAISAYQHFRAGRQILGALAAGVAVLYNPFAPIYLSQATWNVLNGATLVGCWLLAMESPLGTIKAIGQWFGQSKILKNLGLIFLGIACLFVYLYGKQLWEEKASRNAVIQQQQEAMEKQRAEAVERFRTSAAPLYDASAVRRAIISATPNLDWVTGNSWIARIPVPLREYEWMAGFSRQFIVKPVARVRLPDDPSGLPRELLIRASTPATTDYSCHICGAILSAYLLKAESGKVFVAIAAPFLRTAGKWGGYDEQENLEAISIGKDAFVIPLNDHDMGQGNTETSAFFIGLIDNRVVYLGALKLNEDNEGSCIHFQDTQSCISTKAKYRFIDGPNSFKDIIVTRETINNGKSVSVKNSRYRLSTSPSYEYKEVLDTNEAK